MDKLILGEDQGARWMYKNKDRGILSAAASLGLLLLWDVDGGLTKIDPYIESDNEMIKAGALLAVGIVNSTVRNEHEPALALLQGVRRCNAGHGGGWGGGGAPVALPRFACRLPQTMSRTARPSTKWAPSWAWAWRTREQATRP
jgi:hypothetical protein